MKRGVITLTLIGLHLFLFIVALRTPAAADSLQQTVPQPDISEPVLSPVQLSVRQQVPLSLTVQTSVATTATAALTETVAVTLDLQFAVTLTDTVTTTIPSSVTITFGDQQTTTVPISLTVARTPVAAVAIALVTTTPVVTDTAAITDVVAFTATDELTGTIGVTPIVTSTEELTPTEALTPAIPSQVTDPTIVSSITITANLRSGPATTFDIETVVGSGTSVVVVAQNADGSWYLLNNGLWLASFLIDNPPTDLPVATDALVTTLQAQNPVTPTVPIIDTPVDTPAITTTAEVTTTVRVTEEIPTEEAPATGDLPILVPTPTPTVPIAEEAADAAPAEEDPVEEAPVAEELPTVTVDANLRAGPGTDFDVIGGTVTGQTLTIVARNEESSWFLLDNGGWVSATLVANAPDSATIPLDDEIPPAPATETTATEPITGTAAITATDTVTPTELPSFTVQENLYVIRVDGISDLYNFALTQIESLVAQVEGTPSVINDQDWIIRMTTRITLLRSAGEEIQLLTPPPIFEDAHTQLLQAAVVYGDAADLLTQAVEQTAIESVTAANAQIAVGNQLLGAALDAIEVLTP